MKTFTVTFANLLLLFCTSCTQQFQDQQPLAEYRTTATIKDIMDSMVDPGADFIWESVATVISAKGVEDRAPHTDEEWKEVRRRAIMLMEATNLCRYLAVWLQNPTRNRKTQALNWNRKRSRS